MCRCICLWPLSLAAPNKTLWMHPWICFFISPCPLTQPRHGETVSSQWGPCLCWGQPGFQTLLHHGQCSSHCSQPGDSPGHVWMFKPGFNEAVEPQEEDAWVWVLGGDGQAKETGTLKLGKRQCNGEQTNVYKRFVGDREKRDKEYLLTVIT